MLAVEVLAVSLPLDALEVLAEVVALLSFVGGVVVPVAYSAVPGTKLFPFLS